MKVIKIENGFEHYKYRHNFKMIEPIKSQKPKKLFKDVLKEVSNKNVK